MTLKRFFAEYKKVAVAFSGGVDSAYLLYEAVNNGAEAAAYFAKSEFQPAFELDDARNFAAALGVRLTVLEARALDCAKVAANGPDKCYHCKKNNFSMIKHRAEEDGFTVLLDGTNASDDADDRPGTRAATELGVLSPLRMCGITKDQIRENMCAAGLALAGKPSYSCLATRVPQGTPLTADTLEKIERGEAALFDMGFTAFRLRAEGSAARLELPEEQMAGAFEKRGEIVAALSPNFNAVSLDLKPRRVT